MILLGVGIGEVSGYKFLGIGEVKLSDRWKSCLSEELVSAMSLCIVSGGGLGA